MFIYDELIQSLDTLIKNYPLKKMDVSNAIFAENKNQIIFKPDKAFELGGGSYHGLALNLFSVEPFEDEIILIGEDSDKIKNDTNYARISIFYCMEEDLKRGNLYQNIRRIDYMKYQFALDGVMLRESAINNKESLLFSKKRVPIKDVGSYLINLYKKHPIVQNVKIIFINLATFDYKELKSLKNKEEGITKALDHLSNKVKMDCSICKLEPICTEISKLVDNDFKKE